MTGPAYRRAARFFFEPAPRTAMAHPAPFIDHAHRESTPEREAFLLAFAVLVTGLVALWLLLTVALWWVPA